MKKVVILLTILFCFKLFGFHRVGTRYGEKKMDFIKPISIYIDEEQKIYMSDIFLNKIITINGDGLINKINEDTDNENLEILNYIKGLNSPRDIIKINDKLYFSEGIKNRIGIYDLEKKESSDKDIQYIGKLGMKEKFFNHPGSILYKNDEIFIFDEYNYRIQVWSLENKFKREILLPRFNYLYKSQFNTNYSMKFFKNNYYILDKYNEKIYIYEDEKKKEEEINLKWLDNPTELYTYNQKLYVFDYTSSKLINVEQFEDEIEIPASNIENDIAQSEMFINGDYLYYFDNLYLNIFNLRLRKTNLKYKLRNITKFEYIKPGDIKTDLENNIYILDSELSKIIKYNSDETPIKVFENIGNLPSGMFVDEYKNLYVAFPGENSVKKFNKDGKLIYDFGDYTEFPVNQNYYYEKLDDEKKANKKFIDNKIYNLDIFVDKTGRIYVLNSKDMKIQVYNQFFSKEYEMGKKAGIISVALDKKEDNVFGWNEYYNDNLTDFFVGDEIIVLDKYYKRVNFLDEDGFKGYLEDGYSLGGLTGVYKSKDRLYVIDKNSFSIKIYDNEMKPSGEINFMEQGITPIKIWDKYIIASKTFGDYNIIYQVYNIEELINDRSK